MSDKREAWAALFGAIVGGGIVWLVTRPKVESLEKRITKLESLEFRVQEFEATYYRDIKRIEDEYQFLWSKTRELQKATIQIPEMREELESLLSRLNIVMDSKLREKGSYLAHVV